MINKKQIILSILWLFLISGLANAETPDVTTTSLTWTSSTLTTQVEAKKVDVIDKNTLSVNFSWDLQKWISDTSDVKIFKDIKISKSQKDLDNPKKINLSLDEELDFWGYNYSIFSISSNDVSIDFELTWTSSWTIKNTSTLEDTIDYINIVDAKNIEVYFKKDIEKEITDFKMLKEIWVESMFFDVNNLNIKTKKDLMANSAYFFMFISLKDGELKEIPLINSMLDFVTPAFADVTEEVTWTWEVLVWTWTSLTWVTWSWEILTWSWELWNIEQVAMEAKSTPDTWAKTNILIALAFLLSIWFFLFRRKTFKA